MIAIFDYGAGNLRSVQNTLDELGCGYNLVRDAAHGKLIIADGYHRLCAIYSFDEDAVVPCKIASPLVTAPALSAGSH